MFEHELVRYGYVLLFLGVMVEADAFLIAGAYLAHRGYFDIRAVIVLATAATATANQFWFWIARWRGRAYLDRKLQTDRRVQRIHAWLQRRGHVLIPLSRFLYGFRVAIPAVYGASGTSPTLFTALDVASAAFWGLVVGFAGFAFGGTLEVLVDDAQRYERFVLGAIAIAAGDGR
jgi:membrane protein DedA with SNARE-associated domain